MAPFNFQSPQIIDPAAYSRKETEKRATGMRKRGTRRTQILKDTLKGLVPEREPIDRSQIPSPFSGLGQPGAMSMGGTQFPTLPTLPGVQPRGQSIQDIFGNIQPGGQSLLPQGSIGAPKGSQSKYIANAVAPPPPPQSKYIPESYYFNSDPSATDTPKSQFIDNAANTQQGNYSYSPLAGQNAVARGGAVTEALSPELIEKYFRTQSDLPNPLTPLEFAAQQQGTSPQVGSTGGTDVYGGQSNTPSEAVVDAQGNLISGPAETPSKIDTALETYLKSLTASPELTTATKRLGEMDTQAQLDYEKALEMGDTLGFARGEAGLTARQNAILRGGQAATVEAYAALDAQKGKISKARYEYEKSKLDENKPFELSPGQERYEYNPQTGEYEKIASVPKDEKETITTVDGRRVLVRGDQIVKDFGPASEDEGDEDAEVVTWLQKAREAIDKGVDPNIVRQRFLENNPTKGALYNRYFDQGSVLNW